MKGKRAFTLVELVVAMALLTIVLVSFYPIIINNHKVNVASQQNLEAQSIAQNEIEDLLFFAQYKTKAQITDYLNERQSLLDENYQDSSYKVHLTFITEDSDQVLNLKVDYKGKLIYETETWLSYEE